MLLAIKNEPFVEVGGAPKICETHVNIIPKYHFFFWGGESPKDRFHLAIEDHDFSYPCDSLGRKNILIHDIKPLDWSDIPEIAACLVKPGLSNAAELNTFSLAVRPHECTDESIIIRCQHQQYPLFRLVTQSVPRQVNPLLAQGFCLGPSSSHTLWARFSGSFHPLIWLKESMSKSSRPICRRTWSPPKG